MYFGHKTTFCLGLALILLLSCADNSDIAFPSKDEVRQRYSSSAESSSSAGSSSSSEQSSSSIDVSSSSSAQSSSSVSSSSSSSNTSSSSGQNSSSSAESDIDVQIWTCRGPGGKPKVTYYNPEEELCDARDGKVYKWVEIGTQVWMAENLNFYVSGSTCYDDDNSYCEIYGRLYNWATAMNGSASSNANPSDVQGVCPSGWHLPSDAEWTTLTNFVGDISYAGTMLKSETGWDTGEGYIAGTDNFGFSALPGGNGSSGGFFNSGDIGYWWSATEKDADNASCRSMYSSLESSGWMGVDKSELYSVRCIKDTEE